VRAAILALTLIAVPAAAQDAAPDRSQDIAWHNAQQAYLAALRPADGWRHLPGGLKWRRVAGDGSGARPTAEDTVTVHYAGTFTDGSTFDSSLERGEPATFPLGRLIKAWQLAIPQMGVGDTIELAAPALLAYGPGGKGPIPGGATLLFKVQLLGIGERAAS
jgi:FKBP-type peptidyl-prolyl cis-trans isomerase FkpA